jgi:hypothetical protein
MGSAVSMTDFRSRTLAARFVGIGVLAFRGELEQRPAELRELEQKRAEAAKAGEEVQS